MRLRFVAGCAALVLLSAAAADAGEWNSNDGKVRLCLTGDGTFTEVPHPPPSAQAIWVSADRRTRLIFVTQGAPTDLHLNRADLEQGTLNAFPGGSILSTVESSVAGIPMFTIEGIDKSKTLYFQQSILAMNGVVYKLMAAGPARISSDPNVAAVFQSITVPHPTPPAPPPAGETPLETPAGHAASVNVAELGWAVLAVATVVYFVTRKRKGSKPPPLP